MFQKIAQNKTITPFILTTTLLLMLVITFGCGNSDQLVSPVQPTSDILAAPKDTNAKHAEGWIGPDGGIISIPGRAQATFPAGALDSDVYISIDVEIDNNNNKIHYVFGPHGTVFNQPVQIQMNWGALNNYDGPKNLWYRLSELQVDSKQLEDNLTILGYSDYAIDADNLLWVVENTTIDEANQSFTISVDHFSEYYYPRR